MFRNAISQNSTLYYRSFKQLLFHFNLEQHRMSQNYTLKVLNRMNDLSLLLFLILAELGLTD